MDLSVFDNYICDGQISIQEWQQEENNNNDDRNEVKIILDKLVN